MSSISCTRYVLGVTLYFNLAHLPTLLVSSPPTPLDSILNSNQSTKDAMEPLRLALESVLTDTNKPYVLMFVVCLAPLLLFAAHRVELREKQAAARIEGAGEGKKVQ